MNKRHKWRAKKITIDGIRFDSIKESERYRVLKEYVKAGLIRDFQVHPKYQIDVNGDKICTYIADFSYTEQEPLGDKSVVEDVKGSKATITHVYRIKKKLMKAVHGIEIQEVI